MSTTASPAPTESDPDCARPSPRGGPATLVVVKLDRLARSLPDARAMR
jgi:hypothetical protein